MFGEKRYTMLRILSIVLKLGAFLYAVYALIRWIAVSRPFGFVSLPYVDTFASVVLVTVLLWVLGLMASATADTAENSHETVMHLRYLSEQRLPAEQRSLNGMWDDEAPQGERWRNKFRGWRPEKTPITFDDPDDYDMPRRVRRPIKK